METIFFQFVRAVNNAGLNRDRADVIVIAAKIFSTIMRWTFTEKGMVSKLGLTDGIIHELYVEFEQKLLFNK